MSLEHWIAGAVMAALTLYSLGGGADFGGGVWDLLARGPRAARQRDLVAHAIGPIWEANHVWLILAVVLMFVCFPVAWAVLSTALHVPLALMLVGIVLRGSAFTFRSYGGEDDAGERRWGRVFAIASLLTPVTLGMCVGAVASGAIRVREGRVLTGFFSPWLAAFPLAVGLLTLALFSFLAAVYLTREAGEEALREDFRRRALLAGVVTGALALGTLALARGTAAPLWSGLVQARWAGAFHLATAGAALGALAALWTRRYAAARALAIVQVTLVLWGWAAAQFPYVVPPDLTFAGTAAPPAVLRAVLAALAAGALLLVPSLVYLFRVFKRAG
ncbi:MAG TPA: cytochrome d ubiquinol oxidase subunit II [Vicinamibacteria bacterium]|nr:cytochrome d ubiquinol oxidase subunit II [Vicinamibacteria bacterium]